MNRRQWLTTAGTRMRAKPGRTTQSTAPRLADYQPKSILHIAEAKVEQHSSSLLQQRLPPRGICLVIFHHNMHRPILNPTAPIATVCARRSGAMTAPIPAAF